ncbi:MAG: hypothetical protein Q8O68_00640 [Candidatus Daviesbacteria bacterium]|nr:hypothetical protein [Candidatus Daviesbacteria bacterium]
MIVNCYEDLIDYDSGKEYLIVEKEGKVQSVQVGSESRVVVNKIDLKNATRIIHNHPIDLPPSPQDVYTFLSERNINESCVITPDKRYVCLKRTKLTPPPIIVGSRSAFQRSYNHIGRIILYKKGFTSSKEAPNQKDLQNEVLEEFSRKNHIELIRGGCKVKNK